MTGQASRRGRRGRRRTLRRGALVVSALALVVAGGAAVALLRDERTGDDSVAAPERTTTTTSTTTSTTTTTLPPLVQPPPSASGILQPIEARLPAAPTEGVGPDATGPAVTAYQQRLADLRFDPGPVDGVYGAGTMFAVQGLQKMKGLPVTGTITPAEVDALNHFLYDEPLEPGAEANRTEVDVARQVMTVYEGGQPRLLTTVSTGSGEHYCYDTPKNTPTQRVCEVANTPSGRFSYYLHRPGWDVGVLGGLYNPVYFNGGVAVHGYQSVPTGPASHGCVRIPMHIAEYFPTLVHLGQPVYVVGGRPFEILSTESLVPAAPAAPAPAASPAPA